MLYRTVREATPPAKSKVGGEDRVYVKDLKHNRSFRVERRERAEAKRNPSQWF